MNEFSPVIRTSLGSTGGVRGSPRASDRRDLHARVVEARAFGNVRVVRGAERGHGLAVVARGEPGPLERADDAAGQRVADAERQADLAEGVPDADARPVLETAGVRVVGMHLERRRARGPPGGPRTGPETAGRWRAR